MNRKGIALLLGTVVAVNAAGCSVFSAQNKSLLKVNQESYSLEEGSFLAQMEMERILDAYDSNFLQVNTDDAEMLTYVEAGIYDSVREILYMSAIARNEGVALSEADLQNVQQAAESYVQSVKHAPSKDVVAKSIEDYTLAARYMDSIQNLTKTSQDEQNFRVIRGKQIVTKFSTEEEKAAAWDKISKVNAKLENGKTFLSLVSLNNEEDQVIRTLRYADADESWEKELFTLQEGDRSGILEMDHGYMIFLCTDADVENLEKQEQQNAKEKATSELITSTINQFTASNEVIWQDELWDKIDLQGKSESTGFWNVYNETFQ